MDAQTNVPPAACTHHPLHTSVLLSARDLKMSGTWQTGNASLPSCNLLRASTARSPCGWKGRGLHDIIDLQGEQGFGRSYRCT